MWYEDELELALEDEGMPYDPELEAWDAVWDEVEWEEAHSEGL